MKTARSTSTSLIILLIVLVATAVLVTLPPKTKAQSLPPPATLSIFSEDVFSNNITNPNMKVGSTFIIDIRGDNLPPIVNSTSGGVSAIDITVNYDYHILKATGIGFSASDTPTCPSTDTCLWDGLMVLVFAKKVNNPPGSSRLAIAGQGPTNRIQGSGILFRILFQVVGYGYTNIAFDTSVNPPLVGPLGNKGTAVSLPYMTSNGSFDNTPLFTLFASPSSGRLLVGRSIATNVTAFMVTGGPLNVSLSASQLPAGATASFKPSFGNTTFTSLLNITTSGTTPTGNYTVRITGLCAGCFNGADFSNNMSFALSVNIRNVAVLSVTPSTSTADIGSSVPVSVTVKNKGTEYETFSVNVLANTTVVAFQSAVTLRPGTSQTLTLTWNTTTFQVGSYNVTAQIPPLSGESNITDNTALGGTVRLVPPNVGVTSVTPSPTALDIGQKVSVSVAVRNSGDSLETFTVNLRANATIVASRSVSLAAGTSQTLSFTWDTTAYQPGVYNITAQIPPLASEVDLTDNIKLGGNVRLGFPDVGVTSVAATPAVVNPGQPVSISIVIVNLGQSSENMTVNAFATVSGGLKTQVGSLQVTNLAGGQSSTISISWATTGFTPGTYTVRVEIQALQNETNLANNSLNGNTIRLNDAPTAAFTVTTTAPVARQDVGFDASQSSDGDGTVTSYSWDFGDGSAGTGKIVTHAYQAQGTYTVTLTATDNDGATKATTQTVTIANALPTASFTITTTAPTAGQDVSFDASQSSDSDGMITGYSWDFGDGTMGSGSTTAHKYQNAGSYTVTLTVTDNDGGTKTTTQTVTVATAPGGLVDVLTSPSGLAGIAILIVLVVATALLMARRRRGKPQP